MQFSRSVSALTWVLVPYSVLYAPFRVPWRGVVCSQLQGEIIGTLPRISPALINGWVPVDLRDHGIFVRLVCKLDEPNGSRLPIGNT